LQLNSIHHVQEYLASEQSRFEARRLSESIGVFDTDGRAVGTTYLIEFVRAALSLARYSIRSVQAGNQSPEAIKFAQLMGTLWHLAEEGWRFREPDNRVVALLTPAWITLRVLTALETADADMSARSRSIRAVRAQLDTLLSESPLARERLDGVADDIQRLSGWRSTQHASRARNTWVSVESLAAFDVRFIHKFHVETEVAGSEAASRLRDAVSETALESLRTQRNYSTSHAVAYSGRELIDGWSLPAHASVDGLLIDVEPGAAYVPVWYGTNRSERKSGRPDLGFANEREESGVTHFGVCTVLVPQAHTFGSVGTPFWQQWWRPGHQDNRLRVVSISGFADGREFATALQEQISDGDPEDRQVLVFVHGYKTSFADAAIRAAQIGFDLKSAGAIALYSWPSTNQSQGYFADQNRADASEKLFADFLELLVTKVGATRVNIIAHSMGNRLLSRAMSQVSNKLAEAKVKFGAIILAAPDIDVDLFERLATAYPLLSEKTTMYVSSRDRALFFSKSLQDSDRAGLTPPITVVNGIDTIVVSKVDLSLLGHGYFSGSEPVLYDMKSVLEGSHDPSKRLRLVSMNNDVGAPYWTVSA